MFVFVVGLGSVFPSDSSRDMRLNESARCLLCRHPPVVLVCSLDASGWSYKRGQRPEAWAPGVLYKHVSFATRSESR